MAEILYIPFDEPYESDIAYDYAPGAHHADVYEGRFIEGREGNCVYFPGNGYAEIKPKLFDLTQTYTVMFWVMAESHGLGSAESYFLIKFPGLNNFLKVNLYSTLSVWSHVALTHENGIYTAYVNGKAKDTKSALAGTPTGFCLLNVNGFNDAGRCYLDDFKILTGGAYTSSDLTPIISNATLTVKFSINGVDFKSLGITVGPNPKGIVDMLPKKSNDEYDWKDQHGKFEDVEAVRYDVRDIELDCWFFAENADAMMETIINIKDQFQRNGTQRLMVEINARLTLPFEVTHKAGIDFSEMKWRNYRTPCSFKLRMTEKQPVKRILRYIKVDNNTPNVQITLTCPDLLNIYWGDGQFTPNVFGTAVTATHQYDAPGTYYIVIAGVIENITAFTHNAVMVWSKLQ
ncbi:LamG domain-containing protein [Dyadobacter flavalbus]|uniref:LamG domain-containing protein n=1 Tax=Dyadobacter flavalbus TaxID=2579942 RepID=A0A5M8QZ47_9BACT|nr:LamG domain-containing protein [Dyadobacter flavalbus]KAA6441479.1 LamG domain-containing protein [Dyadobacter flavalbus]